MSRFGAARAAWTCYLITAEISGAAVPVSTCRRAAGGGHAAGGLRAGPSLHRLAQLLLLAAAFCCSYAATRLAGIDFPSKRTGLGADGLEYALPHDLGVEHYQILGPAGLGKRVILHVFARFTASHRRRFFYGKAWLEYEEGIDFMPYHFNYIAYFPNMSLASHGTNDTFPLSLTKHSAWAVHAEAMFEDDASTYTLHFGAWRRTQVMRPYQWRRLPLGGRHPGWLGEVPKVIGVYTPVDALSFGQDPTHLVRVLSYNLLYHRTIGYSGFIMYMRPQLLDSLARLPVIRHLIQQGVLLMVLWDVFPMQGTGDYVDQWPAVYHAAVALSGEHVLMHTLDMDDFLGSDAPLISVPELIQSGCMGHASYYRFYNRDHRIPPARLKRRFGPNATEHDAWLSPTVRDPLKLYTEYKLMYAPMVAGSHVTDKFMGMPYDLINFSNHKATLRRNATGVDVHWSCAYIVHLACLFKQRYVGHKWHLNSPWSYLSSPHGIVIDL